jgi:hypothetical protein
VSARPAVDTSRRSDVLALLPLPEHDAVSRQQRRGAACVWDAIALTPTTAVDLGARPIRPGGHYVWFPRGCRRCVGVRARAAIRDHAPSCEQCVDDASQCQTRTALEHLARETA